MRRRVEACRTMGCPWHGSGGGLTLVFALALYVAVLLGLVMGMRWMLLSLTGMEVQRVLVRDRTATVEPGGGAEHVR